MTLLKIQNFNLSINKNPVLKDINFNIERGQILGIVGESGSGKSMMALSIIQLLPTGAQWCGNITFNNIPIKNLGEKELSQLRGNDISMIFQEPMTALNPVKTIGDQVAEAIRIHRRISSSHAYQLACKTLHRVGLPKNEFPLSRYPHNLSGGQRQRVMIAMAIITRPKLLIADEPTTALDVIMQADILKLLKKLVKEDQLSLLFISHDLAVISQMVDNILVMKDGQIVEKGLSSQFFKHMNHPYTRKLFAASNHSLKRQNVPKKTTDVVLDVQSVCCDYQLPQRYIFAKPHKFRAVNNVSFKIFRGENVGLVGRSGCGKSTLARAILALKPIDEGRIFINETCFSSTKRKPDLYQRAMAQIVFQDPYSSFNPRHKVARLIAEPFFNKRQQINRADREALIISTLKNVGLCADDGNKYIHQFSGGQRQRIAIARALIIKPSLIILDEAVSALDVSIRAQVLDLLAELSDKFNLSYLFISHDLSVVRSITDRILVMEQGKIVETGATDKVFKNPQYAHTQSLIHAIPQLKIKNHHVQS